MSMCDHPCHDLALGERLHKDIYEALRAGPKWERTALAIIYDDDGDFYVRMTTSCVLCTANIYLLGSLSLPRRIMWCHRSRAFLRMGLGATSLAASVKSILTSGGSVLEAQLCSFRRG